MADVDINKFRASVVRDGSKPASPGFVVSEGQSPTDPAGSGQNHLPVTITPIATGLSITEDQVLGGAGLVSQYIRGDGSLADFPQSSGGGSSVSYYLNGSVSQGTIGGVAYKELNKVPILGAGTDFTINADGYIASFLTDAGDPNLLEIPAGNWNFETYFNASSSGNTPSFYVELYKYDGTTFTLIASNSGTPEFIAFGTIISPYFSTLAVPTTTLALTDRLAIRYYVLHSGKTITMHTENNTLGQVITTFTTGLTSLNGLTAQVQNLAVGTSGTDFNIASAIATHTFNLPTASATNRGALSSADWTIFNNKQNALGYVPVPETRTITINGTTQDLSANRTFNVGDMLLDTIQTVTARKDYNSNTLQLVVNGTSQKTILTNSPIDTGSYSGLINAFGFNASNNLYFSKGANNNGIFAFSNASTRTYTLKDASGTLAFTSDIPSLSGYVQGSGTTNYLPKFTGASTIGNSIVNESGNTIIINSSNGGLSIGLSGTNDIIFGTGGGIKLSRTNVGPEYALSQRWTGSLAYVDIASSSQWNGGVTILPNGGGNLLIGTTTDNGARLQVSGTATVSSHLTVTSETTSSSLIQQWVYNGQPTAYRLRLNTLVSSGLVRYSFDTTNNFTEYPNNIVIDRGNVGIGTSPNTKFEVTSGNAASAEIQRWSYNDGNAAYSLRLKQDVSAGLVKHVFDVVNNSTTYANNLVLTNGNVGIGTASPVSKLDINIGILSTAGAFSNAALNLYNPTNIGSYSQITFGYTPSATYAAGYLGFVSTNQGSLGYGDLVFGTRAVNTDTQATERLRIASTGAATFSSSVTAGGVIVSSKSTGGLLMGATNGIDADIVLEVSASGAATKFGSIGGSGASNLVLAKNGGNVGIGTASPVERLHVETSSEYQITWARTGSGKRWAIGTDTAGFYFNNRTDSVLPLYITNGGNVLIGTIIDNGSGARLQVSGAGTFSSFIKASGAIDVDGSGSNSLGSGPYLQFGSVAGNRYFLQQFNGSNGLDVWFYNGSTWAVKYTLSNAGAATFSSTVTATGYITSSDARLKKVISKDGDLAIYSLLDSENIHYGYIAQDMQKDYPNQVNTDDKGFLSLNYVEILVKKVNDLEKKIKQLEQ